MALTVFFGIDTVKTTAISFDWRSVIILAVLIAIPPIWNKFKKKEFSSILLVIISGMLGIVLYGI
jgi:hypothetical protein